MPTGGADRLDARVRVAVLAVVAISLIAAVATELGESPTAATSTPGQVLGVANWTAALGATFTPGAPQAFGSNASTIFIGGVGPWDKPTGDEFPAFATWQGGSNAQNSTAAILPFFPDGAVFGNAWNGSSWLFTGESTWGDDGGGALVALSDGRWTNLTALVRPYSEGEGIWADAWNGSAWLVAGNNTTGATLLSYAAGRVTDLTGLLPHNLPGDWIQLIGWNGTGWLIGGYGVFGTLFHGHYTDLSIASDWVTRGVYAADWNGSNWLVGGGSPAATVVVQGTRPSAGVELPIGFDRWVNSIVWTGSGWLISGKGTAPGGDAQGELAYWGGLGSTLVDLTAELPSAFMGGQIQFATWAPALGSHVILLMGQGDLNEVTGYSAGAAATVTIST